MEKRGTPAAVFGTKPFQGLARLRAKALGFPDLALILIEHPLGGIELEHAIAKADTAVEEVAAVIQMRMASD